MKGCALRCVLIAILCVVSVWINNSHGEHSQGNLRVHNLRRLDTTGNPHPSLRLVDAELGSVRSDAVDANAVDDHSDDGHPSLFEALSAIHIEIGTYSVLIIIGFIIILKQILEALYTFTHESAFHGMVKKIEEELMIVGSSSFIFKVVLNTTTFGSNKWAYPLEFGEVLVPLIAFSYCFIGIFLVIVSLKQCYTWSRAHNLKVVEILDDYFAEAKTWRFRLSWMPLNKSIEQMEFRIFHNIFCSTFKIRRRAFAFDEYVAKVFQRSVLELIEIRLLDWFYVTMLLFLNLARVKLDIHINPCSEDDDHAAECDNKRMVRLFTLAGSVIFCATFLLLVLSRRLELAILRRNGYLSHLDYAQCFQGEDEEDRAVGAGDGCMDMTQLKVAAAKAKEQAHEERLVRKQVTRNLLKSGLSMRITSSKRSKVAASPVPNSVLGKEDVASAEEKSDSVRRRSSDSIGGGAVAPFQDAQLPASSAVHSPAPAPAPASEPEFFSHSAEALASAAAALASATTNEAADFTPAGKIRPRAPSEAQSDVSSEDLGAGTRTEGGGKSLTMPNNELRPADRVRSASESAHQQQVQQPPLHRLESSKYRGSAVRLLRDPSFGQHSKEAMDVFWCGRPALYFESVQILFMVIAFYAALWLTVMASSANSSVWKFLSVLPAILICCFFFYIVKTAALLRAIYEVDTNALLEVIEETEAADVLAVEVRDSVLQRLEATGEDPFEEINRLYREFDVKGTDALSRREFGLFMEAMGVSFSHKKWEKIYKEVDRNFDNEISLNEFLLFLYPHHDAAVTQENKRLKAISQRVMDRTSILVSHLAPIADLLAQAAAPVRPSFASGEERDEAGPSSAPRSAPPSAPPSGPPPSTSAARRRSVIAHIHPDMVRSRQNSAAGSSFGGAHN